MLVGRFGLGDRDAESDMLPEAAGRRLPVVAYVGTPCGKCRMGKTHVSGRRVAVPYSAKDTRSADCGGPSRLEHVPVARGARGRLDHWQRNPPRTSFLRQQGQREPVRLREEIRFARGEAWHAFCSML